MWSAWCAWCPEEDAGMRTTPHRPAGRERESLKVTNLRVATEKAKEIDELLQAGQHELLRRRRTQYRHAFVIG